MKKKKLVSRRYRALRNIAIAVLVVAIHASINYYALTPMLALEYAKDRSGVYDPTEVVTMQRVPEMHRFHRLYMIENENMVALGSTIFRTVGWEGSFVWEVDCTEDLPVHCGEVAMSHSGQSDGERLRFYFGRIDDKNIERIELLEVSLNGKSIYEVDILENTASSFELTKDDWIKKDGQYYFLQKITPSEDWSVQLYIRAYNSEGNEVYQSYIDNQSGVSWG